MSLPPQAHVLPGGARLHLHHGPIDLIIGVDGPLRATCFARATARFQTVLHGLAAELEKLRRPVTPNTVLTDPIAQRMRAAVGPFDDVFVTPMAAVAGAVADAVLQALVGDDDVEKAYVNNGGDVAFHLRPGQVMTSASPAGEILLTAQDRAGGVATSGWQGRSHSRGIADAVTVAASSAAAADVAATLIANAVDLPGHPAIRRTPARDLNPDSDLGHRLVTTDVGLLTAKEKTDALHRGASFARILQQRGLICQAALVLQGQRCIIDPVTVPKKEMSHA